MYLGGLHSSTFPAVPHLPFTWYVFVLGRSGLTAANGSPVVGRVGNKVPLFEVKLGNQRQLSPVFVPCSLYMDEFITGMPTTSCV